MIAAIHRAEATQWNPRLIREQAQRFDTVVFQSKMLAVLQREAPGFDTLPELNLTPAKPGLELLTQAFALPADRQKGLVET